LAWVRSDRRSACTGPSPARALSLTARTRAILLPKALYTVSSDTPASAAILVIVVPANPSRRKRRPAVSTTAARRRCAVSWRPAESYRRRRGRLTFAAIPPILYLITVKLYSLWRAPH